MRNNAEERSASSILQDIIARVQEIMRSEVRLARTEVKEEAAKAAAASVMLAAGAVLALYGVGFLLLSAVHALTLLAPSWAAALAVALIVLVFGAALLIVGRRRIKRVSATPEKTIQTVKENIEWVKDQTR